jgi:hypothetical protein
MSPTMRRASGRSTRSSTSWSSSRMATRVSRGFALIKISRFIGVRHKPWRWRLSGTGVAEWKKVWGEPWLVHVAHGNSREECPGLRWDRPRCPRLKRASTREGGPFGPPGLQRNSGKRAIGPSGQAVHRKQDQRANDGEDCIDRRPAQCAHVPARVAEGKESGGKRRSDH